MSCLLNANSESGNDSECWKCLVFSLIVLSQSTTSHREQIDSIFMKTNTYRLTKMMMIMMMMYIRLMHEVTNSLLNCFTPPDPDRTSRVFIIPRVRVLTLATCAVFLYSWSSNWPPSVLEAASQSNRGANLLMAATG